MTKRGGPKCGGKLHGRDGTCQLPAGWGTDHQGWGRCRKHLGNSPTVAASAERERIEHEVRELLVQLGVNRPVEDPLTELQSVAGEMKAWKEAIGEKVNRLTSLRYEGVGAGEQLRAEVALYERAVDRYERILVNMARLDLDARLVRITEQQAALLNAIIFGALTDVGASAELQEAIRPALAARYLLADQGKQQPARLALPAPARES